MGTPPQAAVHLISAASTSCTSRILLGSLQKCPQPLPRPRTTLRMLNMDARLPRVPPLISGLKVSTPLPLGTSPSTLPRTPPLLVTVSKIMSEPTAWKDLAPPHISRPRPTSRAYSLLRVRL